MVSCGSRGQPDVLSTGNDNTDEKDIQDRLTNSVTFCRDRVKKEFAVARSKRSKPVVTGKFAIARRDSVGLRVQFVCFGFLVNSCHEGRPVSACCS